MYRQERASTQHADFADNYSYSEQAGGYQAGGYQAGGYQAGGYGQPQQGNAQDGTYDQRGGYGGY